MSHGDLTIRGAELVTPQGVVVGDLAVAGGRIVAVGRVEREVGEVVDGRGLTVLPGIIDPQVHFREPGLEHKEDLESGSRAAAAGGVTAFLEMPNCKPPTVTREALQDKLDRATSRCRAHFGFFFGATPDNAGLTAELGDEVCGLKIFMGSSTGTLLVDEQAALEAQFAAARVPIAVHAEDETRLKARYAEYAGQADPALHPVIRDVECATIATARALDLARRHRKRLHVLHLSTAEEVELLRAEGNPRVTTETLPQYLFMDATMYAELGTRLQMNPPVRDARHGEALWAGLLDGTIACIATDHAPHTVEEKALPFGRAPSGMPGVETSLPLMLNAAHEGRCTIEHVASWMSAGPARCYDLPNKGRLEVGADGDLAIVDRKKTRTVRADELQSRAGWTPFEGWSLTGWPVGTVLMGRFVYREGELCDGVFGEALAFSH